MLSLFFILSKKNENELAFYFKSNLTAKHELIYKTEVCWAGKQNGKRRPSAKMEGDNGSSRHGINVDGLRGLLEILVNTALNLQILYIMELVGIMVQFTT